MIINCTLDNSIFDMWKSGALSFLEGRHGCLYERNSHIEAHNIIHSALTYTPTHPPWTTMMKLSFDQKENNPRDDEWNDNMGYLEVDFTSFGYQTDNKPQSTPSREEPEAAVQSYRRKTIQGWKNNFSLVNIPTFCLFVQDRRNQITSFPIYYEL